MANFCEECGNPVKPEWDRCKECGVSLTHSVKENIPETIEYKRRRTFWEFPEIRKNEWGSMAVITALASLTLSFTLLSLKWASQIYVYIIAILFNIMALSFAKKGLLEDEKPTLAKIGIIIAIILLVLFRYFTINFILIN